MSQLSLYRLVTALFSLFILFSAAGELTRNEAVLISMETLEMPVYLLTVLGVWKIVGVVALWVPVSPLIKEWAYAGFFFNLSGALLSLVLSRAPFIDDWIAAPAAFVLWLFSFVLYRRLQTRRVQSPALASA
jgi:hypothetical protein